MQSPIFFKETKYLLATKASGGERSRVKAVLAAYSAIEEMLTGWDTGVYNGPAIGNVAMPCNYQM
eukprot:scaffold213116_cov43-Prasinocladus_malaysianus.AAC.1